MDAIEATPQEGEKFEHKLSSQNSQQAEVGRHQSIRTKKQKHNKSDTALQRNTESRKATSHCDPEVVWASQGGCFSPRFLALL